MVSFCLPSVLRAQTLFSEQTEAAGAGFTHHIDSNDQMRMGAGAAWGDYDGDGNLDLYVADRVGPNKLFHNLGPGDGFEEVAASLGVDAAAYDSTGALFGDYDNDGDADLYVMNRGDQLLFRNDGSDGAGGWSFTDVTTAVGANCFGRTAAAAYGDYDNDGWLDLYVANHNYQFVFPEPGDPDRRDCLLHNVEGPGGARVFENEAETLFGAGILDTTIAHSVAFFDYDNDADLDIYVANEVMSSDESLLGNLMWRNDGSDDNGGWLFSNVTNSTGTQLWQNPMGLAVGDYNADGWLDFTMTDVGPNYLYHNDGDATFTERGSAAGIARNIVPGSGNNVQIGWGMVFLDYDVDGWEDLYVATGELNGTQTQPNPLFHNNGDAPLNTFTEVTSSSGCDDPDKSRTVVKGDYDNDGDEDLYVVDYGQSAHLYRNDRVGGDFLVLRLVGTVSNRDAIGARVRLTAAGLPDQYRMVQSGSTTGGGNDLRVFFGMTGAATAGTITIDWPSGAQTVLFDQPVNQWLEVVEPTLAKIAVGPAEAGGSALRLYQ
jgi:hypothetical protein